MTRVLERTAGHYELQETSYAEAYIWCPARVVVGCGCGERLVLSASGTVCRCGEDHAILFGEKLVAPPPSNGASHPCDAASTAGGPRSRKRTFEQSVHDWTEWRVIE
jgi:hypothetical protein